MKIEIEFTFPHQLILPIHHVHYVQAMLYSNLGDRDFASFLHNEGFAVGKRAYRLFTFSRLFGHFKLDKERQQISFTSPVRLVVSSLSETFIDYLMNQLITQGSPVLCGKPLTVASIKVIEKDPVETDTLNVRMLSPITIYTTFNVRETKKTYYLTPRDAAYSDLLRENLERKYQAFTGQEIVDPTFTITPITPFERIQEKIFRYKGTVIKGVLGDYHLQGSPELLHVASYAGLGGKNAMGFGLFQRLT